MHRFAPFCIPTSSAQESSVSPQPPGLLVTLCGSDGGRPNGSEVISKLILICISPPIGDIELLFSCPLPVRVASLRSICVALARFQSGHCRSPARSVGAPRASCTRPPGWSHPGSARPSRRRPRSLPGSAASRLPLLWLGLLVSPPAAHPRSPLGVSGFHVSVSSRFLPVGRREGSDFTLRGCPISQRDHPFPSYALGSLSRSRWPFGGRLLPGSPAGPWVRVLCSPQDPASALLQLRDASETGIRCGF